MLSISSVWYHTRALLSAYNQEVHCVCFMKHCYKPTLDTICDDKYNVLTKSTCPKNCDSFSYIVEAKIYARESFPLYSVTQH